MKSPQAQTNNLHPPINETEHQSAIPNPSPLTTSPSTTPPPPSVHCCSGGGSLSENPSRLTWAPLNGGRGVDGCAYVLERILFSAEQKLLLSWEGKKSCKILAAAVSLLLILYILRRKFPATEVLVVYKSYIEGTQKGSGYGGFLSEGFLSFFIFCIFY